MSFEYSTFGRKAPIQIGEYKSMLEATVGNWLTEIKIPFIYEPFTYKTSKGNYTPDFQLPLINTYIEVKPTKETLTQSYFNLLEAFCLEKKCDLIFLAPDEVRYFELTPTQKSMFEFNAEEIVCDYSMFLGECIKCKTRFFSSVVGSYHCRHCNNHNGDHDMYADGFALFKHYYENYQKQKYGRVFQ